MYRKVVLTALSLAPATLGWAVAEQEPNGIPSSATAFTIGNGLTGNFQNDGEGLYDYFGPFTAITGRTYQFVASVVNGSSPGLDLGIGTVNSSDLLVGGAETDANGIGGAGATETRNFVAPGTGPYYFYIREATGFANGIQSYSVTTALLPAAAVADWNLY